MRSSGSKSNGVSIDGHLEALNPQSAVGWAWCPQLGDQAALVTARLAGVTLFTARAHEYRADLAQHGKRRGACGFVAPLSVSALAEAERRTRGDGSRRPTLDLMVQPVAQSKLRTPLLWRRLFFPEYKQIFTDAVMPLAPAANQPNPFVGLIKRVDEQVIGGWCASVCTDEPRSRIPVSLYVDGLWADTQIAEVPLLAKSVHGRMTRGRFTGAHAPFRFRFRTPAWMRDGRQHEVSVALAGHPDWLVDEPRLVTFDAVGGTDGFAMAPLYPVPARPTGASDGPARGEYEAWMRANRTAHQVRLPEETSLPAMTVLVEVRAQTEQADLDQTLASLRARFVRPASVKMFGPGTGAGDKRVTLRKAVMEVDTDYVAICRAGDRVAARAFETLGAAALEAPDAAIIFGDDDLRDVTGRRRQPRFKTQYCPDRALTDAVFDGLTMISTAAARSALEDSPVAFDARSLCVKVARRAGAGAVLHRPVILCHRKLDGVQRPGRLNERHTAFVAALLENEANGAGGAPVVLGGEMPRVLWPLPAKVPTVSVIIPTRDGAHMFEPLVDELMQDARRSQIDLEIVLMDNESRSPVTHAAFERLREKGGRIIPFAQPFNYSAICNAGAKAATGDVFLFMNDDLVGLSSGLIDELVRHALRPDVGAVGARLAYPDGTNQHCGVGLGIGGVASHLLKGHSQLGRADYGRFRHVQSVSAVTAALMAVRRDVFEAAGGFEEALSVAYNDVDFCLRLYHDHGLRAVYTPHARAYHLESQTRGLDVTAEKKARLAWEKSFMRARWGDRLSNDPHISPNHCRNSRDLRPALPQSAPPNMVVAAE